MTPDAPMSNRGQIQEDFLEHIWKMIYYYKNLPLNDKEKMEGVAFSILTALDSGVSDSPFAVIPVDNNGTIILDENISGDLHENFHDVEKIVAAYMK